VKAILTADRWLELLLREHAPAAEEVVLIGRVTKAHDAKFPKVQAREAFGSGRGLQLVYRGGRVKVTPAAQRALVAGLPLVNGG